MRALGQGHQFDSKSLKSNWKVKSDKLLLKYAVLDR